MLAIYHERHEQKYGPNRSPSPPSFLPPPCGRLRCGIYSKRPVTSLIWSKASFHDLQLSLQRQTYPRGRSVRSFMGLGSITSLHFIYFLYHLSIHAFICCCHIGYIHVCDLNDFLSFCLLFCLLSFFKKKSADEFTFCSRY